MPVSCCTDQHKHRLDARFSNSLCSRLSLFGNVVHSPFLYPLLRQVDKLEETAQVLGKTVAKLGREVKGWPAWASLKERLDAFKRTLPLITDLRNPALRGRHWDQLAEHVGSR